MRLLSVLEAKICLRACGALVPWIIQLAQELRLGARQKISSLAFGLKLEILSPVPLSDVIRNKNMQWKPLADVTLSLSPKFSFLHGWQALE